MLYNEKVRNNRVIRMFRDNILLIVGMLFCILYAGILYNETMPFAEGWYTYYAECINNGEIVYKDFDYLFSPLYIYFISMFTKVFGYKIIYLRILGICFFAVIEGIVYSIFKEFFKKEYAFVASLTAVLYLQSEPVQIFYDYVRVMDIFSLLTVYFLVKWVKNECDKSVVKFLWLAGVSNSLFLLVKQNMGLLFCVYALIFVCVAGIIKSRKTVQNVKNIICYLGGVVIPVLLIAICMTLQQSISAFLGQTGASAIAAKGGILAILFGWLINNSSVFLNNSKFAITVLCIVFVGSFFKSKLEKSNHELFDKICVTLFGIAGIVMIILFTKNQGCAGIFEGKKALNPYGLFLVVFVLFVVYVIKVVYKVAILKKEIASKELAYVLITGSYFAISYGCGMSGGLAEGQATLGVAFLIALLLDIFDCKYIFMLKILFMTIAFLVMMQSAVKKMNYTYNWWGMDEAKFWDNYAVTKDIPILDGIHMSKDTKNAYEEIYHVISENTEKDDPIYCFPQIPIFYTICDRKDPGVRAKVQWFDVASDISIQKDMKTIEENHPKAILIYNTSEYAYESHEKLFRNGEISATRKMKYFLLDFVEKYNYTFYGKIKSTDNNSFLLYYKADDDFTVEEKYSFEGEGTQKKPYLIKNVDDILRLSKNVSHGNDYANLYFKQTADIDMSSVSEWQPIGQFDSDLYFMGIYDGAGHVIENLNISAKENTGVFGQLGGIVCNLGVVNSTINGLYSGVIASHAANDNAMIINCFTDSDISAIRAGGIADNFMGYVINCISFGECSGLETAGALSYSSGKIENVFANGEKIHSEVLNQDMCEINNAVVYVTENYMKSEYLVQRLNEKVESINRITSDDDILYQDWMSKINMLSWEKNEQGYPVLIKK